MAQPPDGPPSGGGDAPTQPDPKKKGKDKNKGGDKRKDPKK